VAKGEFATTFSDRKLPYLFFAGWHRDPGTRPAPECIRLDVEPGAVPSGKPPVRIFVGTESAQYRAERILVWSVKKVRDPSRVYEIYLMKNLEGFDRRSWKTGFTCYRFAIPYLAGKSGRAIYNDVDQIYLSDPAELFDMDMGPHGYLCLTRQETSVMLIDCEKMATIWHYQDAQTKKKKHFREAARAVPDCWGVMPPEWNARDSEYTPGQSKLLHFTTLQTQPWQPFPEQLKYRPHKDAELWDGLEREADAAGFTLFSQDRTSQRFQDILAQYATMHDEGAPDEGLGPQQTFDGHSLPRHVERIKGLVEATGAQTVLDYGSGKATYYKDIANEPPGSRYKTHPAWGNPRVTCYDPGYAPFADLPQGKFDGVISTDVLEHIPEEDIPWVLHRLFRFADKFVYGVAACYPARKFLPNGENAHCTVHDPDWWAGQFRRVSKCYPGVRWMLFCKQKTMFRKWSTTFTGPDLH